MRTTGSELAYQVFVYVVITALLVVCLFPLVFVLGQSFVSEPEWIARGGRLFLPYRPTFSAYRRVFRYGTEVVNALEVSALRTVVGTAIQLGVTLVAGYALSRRLLPGRRVLLFLILTTILFDGGLIPTFLVVQATKIFDTFWAFVLPGLLFSWGVLVFKQFFEGIPASIEESAYMDGASEIVVMTRIVVPMSSAVVAALALFLAVWHWNSWFDALIFTQNTRLAPLQLLLRNMFSNTSLSFQLQRFDEYASYVRVPIIAIRMAVAVVGTVPILLIYPFLQKYFLKGVYLGAIKE